jgi:hypothetical protein
MPEESGMLLTVLAFGLIMMSFQFLFAGQELLAIYGTSVDFSQGFSVGLLTDIASVLTATIQFFWALITFAGISGAPAWVELPIRVFMTTAVVVPGGIYLARLTEAIGSLVPFT